MTKSLLFTHLLARFVLSSMFEAVQTISDIDGTTTKVKTENISEVSPVTNNIYLSTLTLKGTMVFKCFSYIGVM